MLHVGYLPATVEEVYFPQAELIGDIGPSLKLLSDRIEGKLPNAGALLPLREGILSHIAERAQTRRFPLTPQQVVHDVRQVMPEDGIVCLDNGMYKIWFARNCRTHVANSCCSTTHSQRWELACPRRLQSRYCIRVAACLPCAATAAS